MSDIDDIPHKDLEDQKAGDGSYGFDARDFSDLPSFGYRVKKKAKQVLKTVTNSPIFGIAKQFLPQPIQIGMDILLRSLKRAFTKDGGGYLRLRNEDGEITKETLIAAAIRVGVIALIYFGGQWLGIDVSGLLATLGLVS